MIENIDTNVGRLLAEIDRLGMAEETLVVFTTDNGTANGSSVFNAGMRGAKGTVWRGGTRVPSFWRWKGSLPEGVDVPAVTAHLDVLPTLCEIAGVEVPPEVAAKIEGRSLVPLLRDATAEWPDRPLVTHQGRWKRGQAAASQFANVRVREGRWSLVNVANSPDGWELYDVAADPGEVRDVADGNPDMVRRLAEFYDRWWAGVQAELVNENLDGPAENPFKVAYRRQQESTPAKKPAVRKSAGKTRKGAGKEETPPESFPPPTFAEFLAARSRLLPEIARYSPYALVSADDPPGYLVYASPPDLGKPAKDPTHSANLGAKLKERLDAVGVDCELAYPGSKPRYIAVKDYLCDVLAPRD
jgi:arylsulfatase